MSCLIRLAGGVLFELGGFVLPFLVAAGLVASALPFSSIALSRLPRRGSAEFAEALLAAADDEAAHAEKLLEIAARRLDGALFFADAAEALPADVEKIEAAVQGLRKCWLRRPLCPRCDRCGVRHEDIEFSTCRFWQEWAAYDDVQAAATDSE